jgi:anti-sigma factor RsiW
MTQRHNHNGSSHAGGEIPAELLTAHALGQLDGPERTEVERTLAEPAQVAARQQIGEIERLAKALSTAADPGADGLLPEPALREAIVARLNEQSQVESKPGVGLPADKRRQLGLSWIEWAAIGGVACLIGALFLPAVQAPRMAASRTDKAPTANRSSARGGVKCRIDDYL